MTRTTSDCRIEMRYIDPESYASIVNHDVRKGILKTLYRMAVNRPVSKQEIAEKMDLGYHQLAYQLNNQLKEFWTVKEERKVRGTRMELIAPAKPHTVFMTLGKNNSVFIVDPMANLFGPLSRVGTRCDACTKETAMKCIEHVRTRCGCAPSLSEAEKVMLRSNGRRPPYRVIDHAVICAIEGLSKGVECTVEIPGVNCAFGQRCCGTP